MGKDRIKAQRKRAIKKKPITKKIYKFSGGKRESLTKETKKYFFKIFLKHFFKHKKQRRKKKLFIFFLFIQYTIESKNRKTNKYIYIQYKVYICLSINFIYFINMHNKYSTAAKKQEFLFFFQFFSIKFLQSLYFFFKFIKKKNPLKVSL